MIPNQNIKTIKPAYNNNSFKFKSKGSVFFKKIDDPNKTLVHVLKKKVGPNKYKRAIKNKDKKGKTSKKKLKNKISAINIIEPGNPKKTNKFINPIRNNLGVKKLTPLISVTNRVLKRRPIASTIRNEFVDNKAWLINIQKLASIKGECPLITQIVNQCISTTVE